jgi:hypothetical protein
MPKNHLSLTLLLLISYTGFSQIVDMDYTKHQTELQADIPPAKRSSSKILNGLFFEVNRKMAEKSIYL